jgi:hypothetical protein
MYTRVCSGLAGYSTIDARVVESRASLQPTLSTVFVILQPLFRICMAFLTKFNTHFDPRL